MTVLRGRRRAVIVRRRRRERLCDCVGSLRRAEGQSRRRLR
jgi:hypothetical protein